MPHTRRRKTRRLITVNSLNARTCGIVNGRIKENCYFTVFSGYIGYNRNKLTLAIMQQVL